MTDDLARLLALPSAARLSVAGDELALLTLRHEHADKIIIERQRLGPSIDLGELLTIVGLHGLAETPQIQVTEVAVPQLPSAGETPRLPAPADAPPPKARRTARNGATVAAAPEPVSCPYCGKKFKNAHALGVHRGMRHLAGRHPEPEPAVVPEPEPEPLPVPVLVAQSTATSAIPATAASEYTCADCGVSLQLHERCSDCQALLGPEHEAGLAVEHGLCQVCVGYRATEHTLGLVAA